MKILKHGIKNNSGRNNTGQITVNHIGGGDKVNYIVVDFYRKQDMALVEKIIADPNRSALIALVRYFDTDEISYILAAQGLEVGMVINASNNIGSTATIGDLEYGTIISNIELEPGKGAVLLRSGGSYGEIVGEGRWTMKVKIKKRIIDVDKECFVTVGRMSCNTFDKPARLTSGRNRRYNIRPRVKNYAKNPRDRKKNK